MQILLQDEGQLDFDARLDEALKGRVLAVGKQHVVQQRAVVGLAYIARALHGAAGQADLVADHLVAALDLGIDPMLLDRVGVLDRHLRIGERELTDLATFAFGDIEAAGELGDDGGV